ncbi:MAG: glycosyltransferase [Bacteroidales bacterium]|nr:glycosyltransferase [Bacteroidales bacterium]MCF8455820.1 glycosyltransferase [Bacteroidales bacterium]
MKGETILCIAPREWHALWRDTQAIMSLIAIQNRVLYFEPGRDPDRSVHNAFVRNIANLFTFRPKQIQENLIAIPTPFCLPHLRRHLPRFILRITMPVVIRINTWLLIRHVRMACRKLKVSDPILWLYSQYNLDMVGKTGEKLASYYNIDEEADFVDNVRVKELIRRGDDRLCTMADIVFATSQGQCNRRQTINPNTFFIPNGVDFKLFNRALSPNLPQPDDIARLPRPIIGFAGWLGFHIDVELLRKVAERFPHCSLVLVGPDALPDSKARDRLLNMPNVHFLGLKDRHDLPTYMSVFDVALMPYSLSGHIYTAYPLKLHEYLAAGRAIVSTALPEMWTFQHVVRLAATHEKFLIQIDEALQNNSPQAIAARVDVARENTWDERVKKIYEAMEPLLNGAGRK